jgi:hypothetical protein
MHKKKDQESITVYIRTDLSKQITLPLKKDLLCEYDSDKKTLTIKEL